MPENVSALWGIPTKWQLASLLALEEVHQSKGRSESERDQEREREREREIKKKRQREREMLLFCCIIFMHCLFFLRFFSSLLSVVVGKSFSFFLQQPIPPQQVLSSRNVELLECPGTARHELLRAGKNVKSCVAPLLSGAGSNEEALESSQTPVWLGFLVYLGLGQL